MKPLKQPLRQTDAPQHAQIRSVKRTFFLSDAKYLIAYLVPALTWISLYVGGNFAFLTTIFVFGLIPLLELGFQGTTENLPEEDEAERAAHPFFNVLLYLNVPIVYGLLGYFVWKVANQPMTGAEITGAIFGVGIMLGSGGINVAHELGHRSTAYEKIMAQLLLLSSLYMHFFIEHNGGHHKHVATPRDPATSRLGENLYFFWVRSVVMGWLSAWKIDSKKMAIFQVIQLALTLGIGFVFGWKAMACFIGAATVGFLLLETVNYLEHYGLMRQEIKPGIYERVQPHHSWNSNHSVGRILLYELTRHSDHHYRASRKFQILRHFDQSPQMPTGYPGMMLVALVPPLWFAIMNKQVKNLDEKNMQKNKPIGLAIGN